MCDHATCRFKALLAQRCSTHGAAELAAVLSAASPGRQTPLWDSLSQLKAPALFIAGADDTKFVKMAHTMAAKLNCQQSAMAFEGTPSDCERGTESNMNGEERLHVGETRAQVAIIGMCGHAVHVERPEALVPLLRTHISGTEHAKELGQ